MIESNEIFAIYDFDSLTTVHKNHAPARYYLKRILAADGLVGHDVSKPLYKKVFGVEPEKKLPSFHIGSFNELADLQKFSYSLCEELNLERVYLLSVESYNEIVAHSCEIQILVDKMREEGNVLENVNKDKSSFSFKRFF